MSEAGRYEEALEHDKQALEIRRRLSQKSPDRFEYDEPRMIALAPKAEILYCVAFVDRNEVRRIISLRKANRREAKHYVKEIEALGDRDTDPEGK